MKIAKQVIVVRRDLNMSIGKTASQVAHASMAALFDNPFISSIILGKIKFNFDSDVRSLLDTHRFVYTDDSTKHWFNKSFTKVVLGCDSEEELLELHRKAREQGFRTALIKDEGRTEFNGVETYTTLGIGPNLREEIDTVTGHLRLL